MSLLSGILNKVKKEVIDKVADKVADELVGKPAAEAAQAGANAAAEAQAKHEPAKPPAGGVPNGFVIGGGSAAPSVPGHDPAWYESVPAEECQFNSPGTYKDYFMRILGEDFPGYEPVYEDVKPGRTARIRMMRGGETALVIELTSENCAANSFRRECQRNGVKYTRFYFDHKGWWNTRSYVKQRVNEALGL